MGLDAAEFVIAVEDAFGIAIPNHIAQVLLTPRAVVDYVESRVAEGADSGCYSQRAFYKLRSAVMTVHQVPRASVLPETSWRDLLPGPGFNRRWRHLRGVVGAPQWPGPSFLGFVSKEARTVGGTADFLARRTPAFVKGGRGWSRKEIEGVVSSLMADELGIVSFGRDQSFVAELGV